MKKSHATGKYLEVKAAETDLTDLILDFLPDENGKVQVVEYSNVVGNVLK